MNLNKVNVPREGKELLNLPLAGQIRDVPHLHGPSLLKYMNKWQKKLKKKGAKSEPKAGNDGIFPVENNLGIPQIMA